MYLVQPEQMKETLKKRLTTKNLSDKQLSAEVNKINQGILFQNHVSRVQSLVYYKEKYDLDHQISMKADSLRAYPDADQ